jgi:hypothetical protein
LKGLKRVREIYYLLEMVVSVEVIFHVCFGCESHCADWTGKGFDSRVSEKMDPQVLFLTETFTAVIRTPVRLGSEVIMIVIFKPSLAVEAFVATIECAQKLFIIFS